MRMKKDEKRCGACHKKKHISEFYHRGDKAGYRPNCKECFRARNNTNKGRARMAASKEKEIIESSPHKYFIGRIIMSGKHDDEFLESEWFIELCGIAGWEPEYIRSIL